ncbi:GumC family protein [Marinigracilibium pacificum]|uniref:non-specific protein-tyrosine kinase n=1 Tax=Marinigracilibium pacificum TaxID=2729599 RepID=A0A848IUK4_9BACT|nr:tyrosine-protein kinase [Marinigracilibium pacificum]NMM47386.1 polysaccharide biosynthesis tyrosine autokinase [Marinigracilibium pacificum]
MRDKNYDIGVRSSGLGDEERSTGVDWEKFLTIFRKSIPFVILIIALAVSAAVFYVRYIPPLFESSSELKLDVKEETAVIGFGIDPQKNNMNALSGEMELLRSKVFFSRLIDSLDIDVTIRTTFGNFKNEERYKNKPFKVAYKASGSEIFNRLFNVHISSMTNYELSYDLGGVSQKFNGVFGKPLVINSGVITLTLTENYAKGEGFDDYSFIINSRESQIGYIQNSLKVEAQSLAANTIKITFTDNDKYKAYDVVNAIDSLYLEYSREQKMQANKQKIAFLEEQMSNTAQNLENYENYFENFTIENQTVDLQQDMSKAIGFLNELDSQKRALRIYKIKIDKVQSQLENDDQLEIGSLTLENFPKTITELIININTLENERLQLLEKYNENTYAVRKLNNELNVYRGELNDQLAYLEKNVNEELSRIQSQKSNLGGDFKSMPSKGTQYNKAKRFYELQEEIYLTLAQNKMEFEIAQAGTIPEFTILSSATLPVSPIRPNPLLAYAIAVVSAMFLSLVFIASRYILHDKITSQSELERLTTTPVLGVIPKYKKEKLENTRLIVNDNPRSMVSESLRSIRTNMDFLHQSSGHRVITVSSTVSGEGKTFVSVNLGGIIAMSGFKVIVLDLDMRKPKVNLAFDEEFMTTGMSTLLIGKHDLDQTIRSTKQENLYYIPSGPTPPNPSELLMGESFKEVIRKLRSQFDVVILDTPPVGIVSDGVMAMKLSDLSVYVVRADYSKRKFIKTLNRLKHINRFKNISVIINDLSLHSINKGYGYNYGYGYYAEDEESGIKPKKILRFLKKEG